MNKMQKNVFRRAAALLLALSMISGGSAFSAAAENTAEPEFSELYESARDTNFFTPHDHTELKYDEIEYEHIDSEKLLKEISELRSLMEDAENAAAFKTRFLALSDEYMRMDAMTRMIDIEKYADTKDEKAAAEFETMDAALIELKDAFESLTRDALSSPCASALEGLMSESVRERILEHRDMSEEEKELLAKLNKLESEYMSKEVDEYSAALDGVSYTNESLNEAYNNGELSDDEYIKVYRDIAKNKNAVLGEIFIEMVPLRNRIAELNGCESYAEYAYKETYYRDYSPEDAQSFCDAVKEYIIPKYNAYGLLSQYPDENNMPEDIAYYGAEVFDTLLPHFAELSDELLESALYTYEHNAYDLDPAPNKGGTAFSEILPYYQLPYVFNNAAGDWSDVTTTIHELGHNNEAYWKEEAWYNAPIVYDTAEVHSQALELLMIRYYPELFGDEAAAVENSTVSYILDSIVDGCLYDEWQRLVYEMPEPTLKKANELYRRLMGEYSLIDEDDERTEMYGWCNVPHNFTDPMYYLSYATSAAGAMAFWEAAQDDYFSAVDEYLKFTALPRDYGFAESFEALGLESPLSESYLSALANTMHDRLLPVKPYTDVYADSWYGEGVVFVNDYALMNGVSESLFAPGADATREQCMTILARYDDDREDAESPYTLNEGVSWAVENEISDGQSRREPLKREEFVTMLYRYDKLLEAQLELEEGDSAEAEVEDSDAVGDSAEAVDDATAEESLEAEDGAAAEESLEAQDAAAAEDNTAALDAFSDAESVSSWAEEAMNWALENGIINGMDNGLLAPKDRITRAQLAVMLMRFAYM